MREDGMSIARDVEEASLRAWPAVEEVELGGWQVRFSDGFTKRANSVQASGRPAAPLSQQVARCESWYRDRGAAAIFRVTPFADAGLDAHLEGVGYEAAFPTRVMQRPTGSATSSNGDASIRSVPRDEWTAVYARLSAMAGGPPPTLARILSRIRPDHLLAVLHVDPTSEPAACGLAVLDGALLGLFDLVTDPRRRRQGLGVQLVEGLVGWGRERGAARVYLQVDDGNRPARSLYEKLGFETLYHYWYRVRSA